MNKFIPDRKYISIKAFLTEITIRLKGEVNFFIIEFLEDFYFPSAFIEGYSALKGIFLLRSFSFK